MKKITEIAHDLLLEKKGNCAIDFTCGNGFDTYFLAQHFNCVYAFDIQASAIENTRERCSDYTNVHCILDSHANIKQYVSGFNAGIFNCGYLPHGDTTITTEADSVIKALNEALTILEKEGRIVVVLYPGFEAGEKEAMLVEDYLSSLSGKHYDVYKQVVLNRNKVPYIICIDKKI